MSPLLVLWIDIYQMAKRSFLFRGFKHPLCNFWQESSYNGQLIKCQLRRTTKKTTWKNIFNSSILVFRSIRKDIFLHTIKKSIVKQGLPWWIRWWCPCLVLPSYFRQMNLLRTLPDKPSAHQSHEQDEKAKRYDTRKWVPPGEFNMLLGKSREIAPEKIKRLGQRGNSA